MISSLSFYIHTWIGLLQDIFSRIYLCVFYFQTITRFHGRRGNIRLKKSNKIQAYADIYLLLNYSTCFGRPSHPSSRVHKTVVAVSDTDHTIWGASFLKRDDCLVLCFIVLFCVLFSIAFYCVCVTVLFCALFVCQCVLYYCHRVSTQLQLSNISYLCTYNNFKCRASCEYVF